MLADEVSSRCNTKAKVVGFRVASVVLVRFAPPPLIESPLSRLDSRWRIVAVSVVILTTALVRSVEASLCCLMLTAGLLLLARMNLRWFIRRLLIVMFVVGIFLLGPLLFSQEAGTFALVLLLKGGTLFSLTAVTLVTAPLEASLKAAQGLGMPRLLTHLGLLSYRYLFLLGDELARLRIALRVRGFRNRANLHAYRTVAAATGTLLVRGYERAERVEAAMRCRGFDGQFRYLEEGHTSWREVLLVLGVVVCALGIAWVDYLKRS